MSHPPTATDASPPGYSFSAMMNGTALTGRGQLFAKKIPPGADYTREALRFIGENVGMQKTGN